MTDERAWIRVIAEENWPTTDGLAERFEDVIDRDHGRIDNIMAVHSLNPTGLGAHDALYRSAMTGTASLRKVERELLAFVVSLENHCHY